MEIKPGNRPALCNECLASQQYAGGISRREQSKQQVDQEQ